MNRTCAPILVVEDSPEDFETTLRAFRRAGLQEELVHCEDGDDALDYLHQRGPYGSPGKAPRPGVILLDLNLPGTDGREVLAEIKGNDALKSIPVIVLSTSSNPADVETCYRSGASTYVQKPVDLEGFFEAIRCLKAYWLEVAVLPPRGGSRG